MAGFYKILEKRVELDSIIYIINYLSYRIPIRCMEFVYKLVESGCRVK